MQVPCPAGAALPRRALPAPSPHPALPAPSPHHALPAPSPHHALPAPSPHPAPASYNCCCRRISWNPGTILFVQDSVPLPQAAPLPCSALHEEEPCSDGPPAAREAAGGLGVGAIAGAALGAAAAAAAALAAAVWWRRRRRHARPPLLLKAHASMPSELPELQLAENRALAANGSRLVEVSSMSQVISTPRRRAGSSPSQRALAAAPAPAAPASLQAGRSGTDLVVHASSPEPPTPAAQAGPHTGSIGEQGSRAAARRWWRACWRPRHGLRRRWCLRRRSRSCRPPTDAPRCWARAGEPGGRGGGGGGAGRHWQAGRQAGRQATAVFQAWLHLWT